MADNNLDLTIPLETFLAATVGNGTWADVLVTTKQDKPGSIIDALGIEFNGGQLVANQWDNMFRQMYRIHQGNQLITHDSTDDAKTLIATLDTLTADGDAVYIRATVTARIIATPGNLLEAHLGGTFHRVGGAISVVNPISTVTPVGLTTAVPSLVFAGNDIFARVEGEVATDIAWDFTIDELRRLR